MVDAIIISGASGTVSNSVTYSHRVWPAWTGAITTGTASTSATFDVCEAGTIWYRWVDGGTHSITGTSSNIAWNSWTSAAITLANPRPRLLTPEQAQQVQRDEHRNWLHSVKENLKRKREKRRIIQNANTLLDSILSAPQRLELKRYDSVTVIGSDGGAFRVVRDWEGMLWQLDPATMNPTQKLCIHPSMEFPSGDRMATLILWLQADEKAVLRQANRHPSSAEELRKAAARRRYGGWRALPAEAA